MFAPPFCLFRAGFEPTLSILWIYAAYRSLTFDRCLKSSDNNFPKVTGILSATEKAKLLTWYNMPKNQEDGIVFT